MPRKESLSTEEIAKCKHLAALGRSTRSIARAIHRSPHTVARLLDKPAVAAAVSVKKLELSDLYEKRAYECVESATGEKVKAASLQQLAISSGVFIDKARLLRDQPTSILGVQVQVLHDIAALIRDRDERESEEYAAQWRQEHQERAPRTLTAAPEPPASDPIPVPLKARLAHAENRPASSPTQRVAARDSFTVKYTSSKEIEKELPYNPLMHGLPK